MIVFQNPERLMEVMPYLEKKGYLEGLLGKSASILSLTLDEIKEREKGAVKRSFQSVEKG